jgi:GTPase SAR1 family protein
METVDLKLVLLGQPGVGKTCLVYRYLYNTFGETISVRRLALSNPAAIAVPPALSLF